MPFETIIRQLIALPRAEQLDAARAALATHGGPVPEVWNSAFGPQSLFDAWCRTSVARAVHAAVWEAVQPVLRPGFVLIEVGGGDGSTWRGRFSDADRGTIVVVDPVAAAADRVREAVPEGIEVESMPVSVADAALPAADAVVCSLTLHHVAGRDAADRAAHGLTGVGKLEILQAFRASLAPRGGLGVLVEADVDCDLDLAPGDPALADHIFDSYVRRCARSICDDIDRADASPELVERWRGLLRHWFLGQLAVADAPIAARDVYELTVPRWLDLLEAAQLDVVDHGYTDALPLFHRYVLRPR